MSRPQFRGGGCSIEIVVISRSSYQPVGQRVIMSRGSYKWVKKVRNGDGNYILSDFIHKSLLSYFPLVEPMSM